MALLLGLHLAAGVCLGAAARRWGRRVAWPALVPPVAVLGWLAAHLGPILDGRAVVERTSWLPGLGVDLVLRLDGFSAVMVALVSGIGVLVLAYAAAYLPDGPAAGRTVALLVVFSGAMLGLVLADDLLVLYGCWELTSIASFLLIGQDHDRAEARAAALHALLVTGAGALAMLAGFVLLGARAGTYRLSELLAHPPTGPTVGLAVALILVGAFAKSAQYPFHSWLPGAMVAPTPVSAYLHSATMVKAGVYLIARLAPAYAPLLGWWRPVVVAVGLVTAGAGALRALRQQDLKVLLAHGTVSQLGLLVAAFGLGTPAAVEAATLLLVAHALFKAAAFLVVGVVDHELGTRDRRRLPRPGPGWRPTVGAGLIAAASMAGLPPLLGFVAKEGVLQAALDLGSRRGTAMAVAVAASAALTVAYSARFGLALLGRGADRADRAEPSAAPAEISSGRPSPALWWPAAALAVATVGLGVAPGLADRPLGAAAGALAGIEVHPHLALWHGLGAALGLSVLAWLAGAALVAAGGTVDRLLARGAALPDGTIAYVGVLRRLNRLADRVTSISQPGSLPIYAGAILCTAAVVPLWALTTGPSWPGWPRWVELPAHVPIAALLMTAAFAASAVRRRFSAALFLGVAGYAMAGLFVLQGAPDLALTQVAIETLGTVLFVLVLRRLPDRFGWAHADRSDRGADRSAHPADHRTDAAPASSPAGPGRDSVMTGGRRALRIGVAVAVGASVFVLAMVMAGPSHPTPASDAAVARAEPDGHGRNVVNVILVDFRGFDTLGEITVLASAAIGTVALARAGRRPPADRRRTGASAAGETVVPPRLALERSVVLDVSVRIVFAAVLVGSLYLLFAGHNQPGGGFVGGILAGAAVALRYVAGGIDDVRRLSRGRPWNVLGAGLFLAGATAAVPLAFGHPVLTSAYRRIEVPILGGVSLSSVTVFDLGVYLAVAGLALMVFESFGDDGPEPAR